MYNDWLDDVQPEVWYTVEDEVPVDAAGNKAKLVLDGMANDTPVLFDFELRV